MEGKGRGELVGSECVGGSWQVGLKGVGWRVITRWVENRSERRGTVLGEGDIAVDSVGESSY